MLAVTAPRTAKQDGVSPYWKIRIVMRGAGTIHAASADEPKLTFADGRLTGITARFIEGETIGDTIAYIACSEVSAVTWRYTG